MIVHHQTQRPALHVGWADRAVVAPGYLADLNLIDLDRLRVAAPRVVADLRAGGSRLLQEADGYDLTIKSGVATYQSGVSTGLEPRRLVRGARSL